MIDESLDAYDISSILDGKNIPFVARQNNNDDNTNLPLLKLVHMKSDGVKFKRIHCFSNQDIDFVMTKNNIIMRIRLNRLSDMLIDLKLQLVRDLLYLENQNEIVEKIWLVLGDINGIILCDDLHNFKNIPFPYTNYPHHKLTFNVFLKPNTDVQKLYAEGEIIDCYLITELRKLLLDTHPFHKYNGKEIIDYRKSQNLLYSDDLMLDYEKNIIRFILRDSKDHYFPCGLNITNIKVGICDSSNNYNLVNNYVCYVKILNNDNENQIINDEDKINDVYEEMIKPENESMHCIKVQNLYAEKYAQKIEINTFYNLKPNHCIILEYMYDPKSSKSSKSSKNLKSSENSEKEKEKEKKKERKIKKNK